MTGPTNHHDDKENQLRSGNAKNVLLCPTSEKTLLKPLFSQKVLASRVISGPAGGSPSKNRNSGDSVVVLSGNQSENGGSNESVCVNAGSPFEDRSAELSTDHGMQLLEAKLLNCPMLHAHLIIAYCFIPTKNSLF